MPQMTDIAANSSHAWRVMCAGAATSVDPTASDYGERRHQREPTGTVSSTTIARHSRPRH